MKTGHAAIASILLLALGLWGCGYALVGRVSNLPEDVKSVYLSPFENATSRSQAEQILTSAIADELVRRQRLKVLSERSAADAELGGKLTGFRAVPVTFDDTGRATTYEIQITVSVAFKRRDTGETIWSRDQYQFRDNYEVELSETEYFDRELIALEKVSAKFAQTLVTDLFEGF